MSEGQLVQAEAQARGLGLIALESRPVRARACLRRARLLPVCGALAGVLLPTLRPAALARASSSILGFHSDGSRWRRTRGPFEVYIGYLAGALLAELRLARPAGGPRRAAALVPRELPDDLPGRVLWAQRGLAALAATGPSSPWRSSPTANAPRSPTTARAGAGRRARRAPRGGLEALERRLVRRPQLFAGPRCWPPTTPSARRLCTRWPARRWRSSCCW